MIASFCVVAFTCFVSCQVYDQDTNEVVYTAMPRRSVEVEDVVKDIEKAFKV